MHKPADCRSGVVYRVGGGNLSFDWVGVQEKSKPLHGKPSFLASADHVASADLVASGIIEWNTYSFI